MQVVKLFFCLRLPEGSMFKWSQIDWRSTIFNEPSLLSWTRWHMFLVPTTIGCWGEATCCITSFRREASETSNSLAVISSLSTCFCAAARGENSWLICWGVLHSSGWNRSLPTPSFSNCICLLIWTESTFSPIRLPCSNISTRSALDLSDILDGFFTLLRAHPCTMPSFLVLDSRCDSWSMSLTAAFWRLPAAVAPVTQVAHFLRMVSYNDSDSSSFLCFPVSTCASASCCDLKVSTQPHSWQEYMSVLFELPPTMTFSFVSSPNGSITFRLVSDWGVTWRSQYFSRKPGPMSYACHMWILLSSVNWKLFSKLMLNPPFDVSLHWSSLTVTYIFASLWVREVVVYDFYTRVHTDLRKAEKKCSIFVTASIIGA